MARGLSLLGCVAIAPALAAVPTAEQIADLSLEQLGNIEVTSVSKRPERLQDAPASIYVITAEEIRRSGATRLPEALRLAPNLQVAQVSTNQWAITARGFNNGIGNKLLVLVDGRTVYTPLFSGVFWDAQDVPLRDVERIEVISGPGGTLWGANAVNGVINVITRPSTETQGTLVSVAAGNRETQAEARYGGTFGTTGTYRVYGLGYDSDATERANGASAGDSWRKYQMGFRGEWGAEASRFTLQGDVYQGEVHDAVPFLENSGGNVLFRWSRALSDGARDSLQFYYDRSKRSDPLTFADQIDLVDVEYLHALAPIGDHSIQWGAGYRAARDKTEPRILTAFLPAERNLYWGNLFAQDEFAVASNTKITIGAKVETNVYTGAEFLPNLRVAWTPSPDRLVWGEISRAVRAPARIDREFRFPGKPPFFILGGPNFVSEIANVFELGYRAQPSASLSFSATAYYHDYERLRSGQPPPAMVENKIEGSVSGIEAWGSYRPTSRWLLSIGGFEQHQDLRVLPGSTDPIGPSALGNDPKRQWMLRSASNLGEHWELDVRVRYVGELPQPKVPSYTAVDVSLGWRATPDVELALVVNNAFDPGHVEFNNPATANEVARSVFARVTWRL